MKYIKFEQLDDKKFQELNEEEMKNIKGGKMRCDPSATRIGVKGGDDYGDIEED